ncbi:hypothetical protein L596_015038 [Steinernema carpocapsae]|uniref:Uncharacterized protein n=1 Tax=Steinernema carpocapsae TaxID=34508 RepID=A0A4U5NEM5_STECR|nr:hypothetical protein L596_015038 [Steinernema carpocapsae]
MLRSPHYRRRGTRPYLAKVLSRRLLTSGHRAGRFICSPAADSHVERDVQMELISALAIQYSMEATYFKEQQGEVVRTSVIHTAPGCTSVLDCDSDHGDHADTSIAVSRNSGPDEQWESTGDSTWRNQQLRLSLNRNNASLLVFPYREVNTQPESFDRESLLDVESAQVPDENSSQPRRSFETAPVNGGFEIRCLGMSDVFLHKFNSSFKR